MAELIQNKVLVSAVIAWILGQFLKFPIELIFNKRWNWGIMFSSGGLPSSHSALVTSVSIAIGLEEGFNTSIFVLSAAIAMIVIYDAAGVRRQAGIHAERINEIMRNFIESGHFPEGELKEMLGHTTVEVVFGVILGIFVCWFVFGTSLF